MCDDLVNDTKKITDPKFFEDPKNIGIGILIGIVVAVSHDSSENQKKNFKMSFRKAGQPSANLPPFARISVHNSHPITSTGIPALDEILPLPLGSLVALTGTQYSTLITKYFLAQGVVANHVCCVVGANQENLYENLMGLSKDSQKDQDKQKKMDVLSKNSDKLKIAWRYQNLQKKQNCKCSHFF